MDHHRVLRVLHLVRDAGRQPPERGELARVADRGLHFAQVLEVARDQHDADELALGIDDRVRHDEPLAALAERSGHGPARLPVHERLLGETTERMIAGEQRVEARAGLGSRRERAHRRIREQELAACVDDRDRVLELLHGRLEVGDLPRHLRPVRRQLLAHLVEEGAELAELVPLAEVQPHAELAAPEAREAAANHVDRPEQQLREQHRDQH